MYLHYVGYVNQNHVHWQSTYTVFPQILILTTTNFRHLPSVTTRLGQKQNKGANETKLQMEHGDHTIKLSPVVQQMQYN